MATPYDDFLKQAQAGVFHPLVGVPQPLAPVTFADVENQPVGALFDPKRYDPKPRPFRPGPEPAGPITNRANRMMQLPLGAMPMLGSLYQQRS